MNYLIRKKIVLFFVVIVSLTSFAQKSKKQFTKSELTSINGEIFTSESLHNKVIVLHLFHDPSNRTSSKINELYKPFNKDEVVFFGISPLGYKHKKEEATSKNTMNKMIYLKTDNISKLFVHTRTLKLPSVFVYNKQGKFVYKNSNHLSDKRLTKLVTILNKLTN